jgi:hypothetical protein
MKSRLWSALLALMVASPALAQVREDGVLVRKGVLGQTVAPDAFQVAHPVELKGAHRVAIAVFNVAFPDRNHYTAKSSGSHSGALARFSTSSQSVMDTSLKGVDQATRQRIADAAYASFVSQLRTAGYEVVDQQAFSRLAPERQTWTAQPNFSQGRFGAYVAPSGMAVYFMPGDAAKRDTSGMFGQQMMAITASADRPQAFQRSAYLARDADLGVIAVSLVVDYGVYSSSGENIHAFGGQAATSWRPGVTIAAGNAVDRATAFQFWGPKSGGFPTFAFLQQPIRSARPFAAAGSTDFDIVADASAFEAAANEATTAADAALVALMVQTR